MNRVTHDCQQGSQAWLDLRAKHFTASELAAAAGESKYQKRSALLKAKATGIAEEVDDAKQRLFDAGHESEKAARPIVENIIDAELYPVTMSVEIDGLPLLASLDGIDILGDVIWENKLRSESLVEQVNSGRLDPHYTYQIEQQLLVSGAGRCYFTTSDGTPEGTFGMWYESNPEIRAKIVSIWKQFAKDLAEYQHVEVNEMPTANVTVDLPALFVHARGEITTHNMDEFGRALAARLCETRAIVLVTDQDFSNAKETAKKFRETAKAIVFSKEQMLAQTETIGEAARKMDAWAKDLNATALQLEKDTEREDQAKKEAMVLVGKGKYAEHIAALEAELAPLRLILEAPNFADAIKGKRNYKSMQDAIDTALAGAKIEADAAAKDVRSKLSWIKEHAAGHSALFPDLQQIIFKPMGDFALTITSRIDRAKADEATRLEAKREKIRAEEVARANAEAVAKIMAPAPVAAETTKAPEPCRANDSRRIGLGASASRLIDSISEIKRVKLGTICARLGFTMTAEFVESLGFRPVGHDKNAKLYSETQFLEICEALIQHISKQANAERSE